MRTTAQGEDVKRAFEEAPSLFPLENRKAILQGVVLVGMTPVEAQLAGGAFTYGVTGDPKKWPPGTDPMTILRAQSDHPDESSIWMQFYNSTQFGSVSEIAFRATFHLGRVSDIQKIQR